MVMRWAQVPIRLGASLPRSSADFGIGVTFQQLFLYGAPPRCFRAPWRIWTHGD